MVLEDRTELDAEVLQGDFLLHVTINCMHDARYPKIHSLVYLDCIRVLYCYPACLTAAQAS